MDILKKCQFTYAGMLIAGGAYFCNEAMKICFASVPNEKIMTLSLISITGGILLDFKFKEGKYEKLFKMCGLENKDKKIPIVIKEKKISDIKKTIVLKLPEGLSQSHFENKKEELEQYFNAKVEFGFNKNLVLDIIYNNIQPFYPFQFKQCNKSTEINLGVGSDEDFILDISKDQHIIIAGETDSGKSTFLDTICLNIILSKFDNIHLYLVDFQDITLGKYEECKKVKCYCNTPEDFDKLLDKLEEISDERIKLFRSVKNKIYIEKIETWNELYPERALPYIFVVVDEFATLADDRYKDIFEKFKQRVSKDRKVGTHFCIALQRPSAEIIQGSIKNNMPTRIAFKAVSPIDSEVILGGLHGAEKIKYQGRFLCRRRGELKEYQALYIPPKDIRKLLKENNAYKSKEEIQTEKYLARKQQIEKFHKKNINPYIKKDVKT